MNLKTRVVIFEHFQVGKNLNGIKYNVVKLLINLFIQPLQKHMRKKSVFVSETDDSQCSWFFMTLREFGTNQIKLL